MRFIGVFVLSEGFMKFKAICENHLYQKAYAKGKRAVMPAIAVYVLPDYAAKRLALALQDNLMRYEAQFGEIRLPEIGNIMPAPMFKGEA